MRNDLTTSSHLPWEHSENLEAFAREYVLSNGDGMRAARLAKVQNPQYRLPVWVDKLLARDDVRAMIERFREEQKQKPLRAVTPESLIREFEATFNGAFENDDLEQALTAKWRQAELFELVEKIQTETVAKAAQSQHPVTRETLADDLQKVHERAIAIGDYKAAGLATKMRGALYGYRPQPTHTNQKRTA